MKDLSIKECHLSIGDRVTSKKTGLPMVGEVAGIMQSILYLGLQNLRIVPDDNGDFVIVDRQDKIQYVRWTQIYPYWMWYQVAYVKPDYPIKSMSFSEFKGTIEEYNKLPSSQYITYPILDLEKMDV